MVCNNAECNEYTELLKDQLEDIKQDFQVVEIENGILREQLEQKRLECIALNMAIEKYAELLKLDPELIEK